MAPRHLPVVPSDAPPPSVPRSASRASALRPDGSRAFVHTADVRGPFTRARTAVFALLITFWAALPWVTVGGHPALFLDVQRRQFFLLGHTFNAQDLWLLFFLLTGAGFSLVYVTAVLGRAWCGWACPQTVFLEGIFRRIERWVEGPREKRMRLMDADFSAGKVLRKIVLHGLYLVASAFVAHIFVSYFVSLPALLRMVRAAPSDHPEAFAWATALTLAFYVNFAWFREQLCVVICPYGRLQSVLLDRDSLVVGYDHRRGEPRGKAKDANAGDCVDCNRCVVVCPTGIDIRNGIQLDCIACTQCIDACDEVMTKLGRPRGLVRYDSLRGLEGKARRILRPRIYVYTALLGVGAVVASMAFSGRTDVEANVLRLPGPPYVVEGGRIRNAFEVHVVNKGAARAAFHLTTEGPAAMSFVVPVRDVELDPLASVRLPVFATMPAADFQGDAKVSFRVERRAGDTRKVEVKDARGTFLGARVP